MLGGSRGASLASLTITRQAGLGPGEVRGSCGRPHHFLFGMLVQRVPPMFPKAVGRAHPIQAGRPRIRGGATGRSRARRRRSSARAAPAAAGGLPERQAQPTSTQSTSHFSTRKRPVATSPLARTRAEVGPHSSRRRTVPAEVGPEGAGDPSPLPRRDPRWVPPLAVARMAEPRRLATRRRTLGPSERHDRVRAACRMLIFNLGSLAAGPYRPRSASMALPTKR